MSRAAGPDCARRKPETEAEAAGGGVPWAAGYPAKWSFARPRPAAALSLEKLPACPAALPASGAAHGGGSGKRGNARLTI